MVMIDTAGLGPEATELLVTLDRRLRAAEHLLAWDASDATVRAVERALSHWDHLFAELVRSPDVDDGCAQRIASARDALGSCVLAAGALSDAALPAQTVLRHGVDVAGSGIHAVLTGA